MSFRKTAMRSRVIEPRTELASTAAAELQGRVHEGTAVAERTTTTDSSPLNRAETPVSPPTRSPNSDQRIHVEFDGQDYQLVVSVAPDQPGHLYVRPLKGGPRRLASAAGLKLLGFVGG